MSKVTERRAKIKDYILNRPNEYISSAVGAKYFGVSSDTFRADFKAIAETLDGHVEIKAGSGMMFIPSIVPARDRELEKNAEGYPDPTAAQALANAMMSNKEEDYLTEKHKEIEDGKPKAGEVWEAECSNGFTDMLLIVKTFSKHCLCLKLNDEASTFGMLGEPVAVTGSCVVRYMGNIYSVMPNRIGTKPTKYIRKRLFELSTEQFEDICDLISAVFMTKKRVDEFDKQLQKLTNTKMELDVRETRLAEAEVEIKERDEELTEFGKRLYERQKQLDARERQIEQGATENVALELALLRQKVEIYERLIFGGAGI